MDPLDLRLHLRLAQAHTRDGTQTTMEAMVEECVLALDAVHGTAPVLAAHVHIHGKHCLQLGI